MCLILVEQITIKEDMEMHDIFFVFMDQGYRDWTTIVFSIKFTLFYAFMLYQCFELELLGIFILTQSSVKLE